MLNTNCYDLNTIDDHKLFCATVMARYEDKWIFVRVKGETTWQIPGGHRKGNEDIEQTANYEV